MAVIYVAEGQEDKMSILSNSGGSAGFEVRGFALDFLETLNFPRIPKIKTVHLIETLML